MHIANVLITGANRGLGLEFVKQFINLPSPPNFIFATCRDPGKADDLQLIAKSNPTVKVLQLDIKDEKSYPEIRKVLEQEIGSEGLNLLINNAGIGICENLDNVTKETMMESFEVNTVSPLLLSKELLPLLKTAASKSGNDLSCARSAIVNITSKKGSIDENTTGSGYSYRPSKTALNMVTKSLSIDLKPHGILCFVLHPGRVKTDMGRKTGVITPPTSVSGMMNTILQANEKHCGLMFHYDGTLIPW